MLTSLLCYLILSDSHWERRITMLLISCGLTLWLLDTCTEVSMMKALLNIDLHFKKRWRWFMLQDVSKAVTTVLCDLILPLSSAGKMGRETKVYRAALWEGLEIRLNKSQCRTNLEPFSPISILWSHPHCQWEKNAFFVKNCSDRSHRDHSQRTLGGLVGRTSKSTEIQSLLLKLLLTIPFSF